MKYVYPAILTQSAADGCYYVSFADLENVFTDGKDLAEALEKAADVLGLMLTSAEDDGEIIPAPSPAKAIKAAENQIVTLVETDTAQYRRLYYDQKSVKKNLSIPSWLNAQAERKNINFSQVLQEALCQRLGL